MEQGLLAILTARGYESRHQVPELLLSRDRCEAKHCIIMAYDKSVPKLHSPLLIASTDTTRGSAMARNIEGMALKQKYLPRTKRLLSV